MRRVLFFKIVTRLALFIVIDYYVFAPLPGWLVDYEFIQAAALSDYIYTLTKPEWGAYPYPDLQDDIYSLFLFGTSLIPTLLSMAAIEWSFNAVLRRFRRNVSDD